MLGFWELLAIFIVVLLLFGKGKAIEVARTIGEAVREFNRAKSEIEKTALTPVVSPIQQKIVQQGWAKDIYGLAKKVGIPTDNKPLAEITKELAKKLVLEEVEKPSTSA
ncbi:MAG: hypothetical protein DRJ33_06875 [Candidatus Methanomethylicota archaeon]|uniref:Twin-arginine translocase TatA/TatE family subunit n=1 Tax=Thermoproteota archaeon TaxID=2056631 RepID=A0A497EVA5_9CREN|nr:MAG: hypothetical protein DRJ33_06875 [Candidatus Verstraetearchaeota archaeon]